MFWENADQSGSWSIRQLINRHLINQAKGAPRNLAGGPVLFGQYPQF
jgi:hypothetical protein